MKIESAAPRPWRSVAAVFAGIATTFVQSLGTDFVLFATGVFPPYGQRVSGELLALATTYCAAFAGVGRYVTAQLAPDRPMRRTAIMAAIGFALGLLGVAANIVHPERGPLRHPIAVALTAVPCVLAGAKLQENRSHD
jgi:hypothetical protein